MFLPSEVIQKRIDDIKRHFNSGFFYNNELRTEIPKNKILAASVEENINSQLSLLNNLLKKLQKRENAYILTRENTRVEWCTSLKNQPYGILTHKDFILYFNRLSSSEMRGATKLGKFEYQNFIKENNSFYKEEDYYTPSFFIHEDLVKFLSNECNTRMICDECYEILEQCMCCIECGEYECICEICEICELHYNCCECG